MKQERMEEHHCDVLIIDDEADILLVVGDYLRRNGLTVITAQDTSRALAQLDENKVRAIVLDLRLAKDEDGRDLMSFLKHNHPAVGIIIYTGLPHDDKEVQDMLAKGASGYVSKGPELQELLFAIKKHFSTVKK